MMVVVLALPLGMGLALVPLRRLRFLVVPLAAATALVTGVLLLGAPLPPLNLLGRVLELSMRQQVGLAFCSLLLAVTMLFTYRLPQEPASYALALAALALFIASTAASSLTLGALLLELGMIMSAMLLASEHPGAPMRGMRTLVLVVLAGALLLIGSWALEQALVQPDDQGLWVLARVPLLLGMVLALGVAPLSFWLPDAFRTNSPLATVVCSVLLCAAVLFRLSDLAEAGGASLTLTTPITVLLLAGVGTVLFGDLLALLQKSMAGVIGYAAVADLGLVLIGLGLGSASGLDLALLHFGLRSVGILVASIALGVLHLCFGSDDIEHLEGSFRLAPFAVIALLLAGYTLIGLPPAAGWPTRLSLYLELALTARPWALALLIGSLAPAWSLLRFALAAMGLTLPRGRPEPLWYVVVSIPALVLLVGLGLAPQLVGLLPGEWLGALFHGVLYTGSR